MKKILPVFCLLFLPAVLITNAQSYTINTIAGNGTGGYNGDGIAATTAELNLPYGVAVDTFGNIYIADNRNFRIRKISVNGIISTIAGNGTFGRTGDGGPATDATLQRPVGIAVDDSTNIYFNDSNAIRKVNTKGIISTIAGTGVAGYSGDGGNATDAKLNQCIGVAVDKHGNLYIADWFNSRIRMVNAKGIITTVAGSGVVGYTGDGGLATSAELDGPFGIGVDNAGNIYIADEFNQVIRKVNSSGIISTVTGGPLSYPLGVQADDSGNVYVADWGNNVVQKISVNGGTKTIAGNGMNGFAGDGGPATAAEFDQVFAIALQKNGSIYIADDYNYRIRKLPGSNNSTDVNQISVNSNQLSVYPNPSSGLINITSTKNIDDLKVTNTLGQLVYETWPKQNQFNLELKNEGMYFVTVTSDNTVTTKKMVVTK